MSEGRDFLHGQVVFVSFPEQLFRRVPVAVDEAHDLKGRTVHASPVRRLIVDNRTNLAKSTVEALRQNFGSHIKIYKSQIPMAVKAAEVASKGESIFAYEPNSPVSKAYSEFTKEVLADGKQKERLHSAHIR